MNERVNASFPVAGLLDRVELHGVGGGFRGDGKSHIESREHRDICWSLRSDVGLHVLAAVSYCT